MTYDCRHPGCFGSARFVATDNVPAFGHLCSICHDELPDAMKSHYAPVQGEVAKQATQDTKPATGIGTVIFYPYDYSAIGDLGELLGTYTKIC